MTREEAITILKAFMENPLFSEVHKAAFNIAIHDIKQCHDWDINKLMLVPKTEWEQEPTSNNDLGVDAVSRQEVLDLIADYDLSMGQVVRGIHALPSVTPIRPKGHWIDDMSLGYHVSICSNCNWRGHGDTCLIYKPKYCPNCGAKMVDPQEGSDKE